MPYTASDVSPTELVDSTGSSSGSVAPGAHFTARQPSSCDRPIDFSDVPATVPPSLTA